MNEIKCVQCGARTIEASDITLITAVDKREVVITGLKGSRCPVCREEYLSAESAERAEQLLKKFQKPAVVFKRKITTSGGRRVIGIPEEIDRVLGKKENADVWLEGNKFITEVY